MGFLEDMIAKGKALRSKVIPTLPAYGDEHTAIQHDRFDTNDWAKIRGFVPTLDTNIKDLNQSHDYVEDFFEDQFNLLHQGDPLLRDKKDMDERFHPNHDLADRFKDMPEIQALQLSTRYDEYATAMAMLSMQDSYREAYEQAAEAREAAKKAAEEREKLQELLDQLGKAISDAESGKGDGQDIQDLIDAIEEQFGITVEMVEAAQDAADGAASQGALIMRAGAKEAQKEIEAEQQAAKAFGVEDGVLQKLDFEERRQLSERLSRLHEYAKLIGAAMNVESGEARKRIIHAPDEVAGVELGDDLLKVTSGELLNLADPVLELDFFRRMASHELQIYQLRGVEKMGKGPIVCVVDESGSMHGSGDQWSKAIVIALMMRCKRDKRDFTYIGFSSQNQTWRKDFPQGQHTLDDLIELVEHFFGGGTYYERPLGEALDIIEEAHDEGRSKPDILFVTDDAYCDLDPEFVERWSKVKAKTSLKCYGVLIGAPSSGALDAVSDNVRSIEDLSTVENMRDVFRMV